MDDHVPPDNNSEKSVAQHENWIRSCADSPVVTTRSGLALYEVDLGPNGDQVIACLLSARDANSHIDVSDNRSAVAYPSLFDFGYLVDGPSRELVEVLVQTATKAFIISGLESDYGVTRVRHVSGNSFLIQTGHVTHDRVYLLLGDSGEMTFLTNGEVDVFDAEKLVFRIKGSKSYFDSAGGAFWFDALIDRDGRILDLVTPDGPFVVCMNREELAGRSPLDLSRVPSREVCVAR